MFRRKDNPYYTKSSIFQHLIVLVISSAKEIFIAYISRQSSSTKDNLIVKQSTTVVIMVLSSCLFLYTHNIKSNKKDLTIGISQI